jgi:hypothetical protein
MLREKGRQWLWKEEGATAAAGAAAAAAESGAPLTEPEPGTGTNMVDGPTPCDETQEGL